ncbi:MAG: ankyrin-like [Gammaproteobacteria bacterium]|jgi:hypothetical protein|nr:ankyrin-like [Gammaproteobacteria bacterium]
MSANNPMKNKVTQEKDKQFISAICSGNVAEVSFLIKDGADINAIDSMGNTPLHWAIQKNDVECINLLVQAGANINIAATSGDTPLHLSAAQGRSNIASLLIKAGADINSIGFRGKTPLHWAVQNNHAECVTFLVIAGATINTSDGQNDTPLHLAAAQGHPKITAVLIAARADISARGSYDEIPLHWAARNRRLEVCAFLMARGADMNMVDSYGISPLKAAPPDFRETLLNIDAFIKTSACWDIWDMPEAKYENFLQWVPNEVLQDTLPLITTIPEPLYSQLTALFTEYPEILRSSEEHQAQAIPPIPASSSSLAQNHHLFYSPIQNQELKAQDLIMAISQEFLVEYPPLNSGTMKK